MTAAEWFIARDLRNVNRILKQNRFGKTASAFLLAVLVLLLSALGASPALHKLIHDDASAADHQCAISLFASGQVDSAPAAQILIGLVLLFGGTAILAAIFGIFHRWIIVSLPAAPSVS